MLTYVVSQICTSTWLEKYTVSGMTSSKYEINVRGVGHWFPDKSKKKNLTGGTDNRLIF